MPWLVTTDRTRFSGMSQAVTSQGLLLIRWVVGLAALSNVEVFYQKRWMERKKKRSKTIVVYQASISFSVREFVSIKQKRDPRKTDHRA